VLIGNNALQNVPVKKRQRAQRLVLRRRGQTPADDQVVEEGFGVGGAQLRRVRPPPAPAGGEGEKLSQPGEVRVDRAFAQPPALGHDDELIEHFHGSKHLPNLGRRCQAQK
jgi:hypothetical protein